MKIYRVGGSVRDELLGRPLADRDYVVVGATPDELLARGFRPVGRDFPVFLHPETHEEYALARTERKTGRGHQGFTFHAAPGVTLEEDLARRDGQARMPKSTPAFTACARSTMRRPPARRCRCATRSWRRTSGSRRAGARDRAIASRKASGARRS